MVKKNQLSLLQVKTNQIFETLDLHKYSSYFGNIHAFNLILTNHSMKPYLVREVFKKCFNAF